MLVKVMYLQYRLKELHRPHWLLKTKPRDPAVGEPLVLEPRVPG